MGNSIPRRQHYIPEMLLKNFCDGDDRLWVGYDGKVFKTTIGNAFVENNLYTKADYRHAPKGVGYEGFLRSITKSYEYEERLSEVESIAEPAVRRILNRARIGKRPKLPTRLALAWKQFLFAMARRTPESQERISPTKSPEDVFYQAALQGTNGDNLPLPAKESFYGSPRVAELQKMVMSNINARFAAGDHPRLASETAKFCAETGLCVAIVRMPKRSFVIGSHGLAIVESEHRGDPAAGSWLPIASDVAVQVTPFPDREFLVFLDRLNDGDRIISKINRASATKSKMVAGRSKALIRTVTRS